MDTIFFGDCREIMRNWAEAGIKAQMCITSPPYFGLRDYGHPGQIGLEKTPNAYITAMLEVFQCVWDVLTDDGTLWLNVGDTYATRAMTDQQQESQNHYPGMRMPSGYKNKDLIGIPWMLAFALRDAGWYLRQDIIWNKPNAMPESVRDRCTKSHEYIFLLSKSKKYYFNNSAIKQPLTAESIERAQRKQRFIGKTGFGTLGKNTRSGVNTTHGYAGLALGRNGKTGCDLEGGMRNPRSVWTIATKAYNGAHFATFPVALAENCILAGSKQGDIILDPFMGSGTTAAVALQQNRHYIGCEINPDYRILQERRIREARIHQMHLI